MSMSPSDGDSAYISVMSPLVVIRPILPPSSTNQRWSSGPAVMPCGRLPPANGTTNSVMTPAGVIRPICAVLDSVNHRLPSGPATMSAGPTGMLPGATGSVYSVTTPVVVMRPILLLLLPSRISSVNHSASSGPAVMPTGALDAVGSENKVMSPAVVIRPMKPTPLTSTAVNQRLLSGP